MNSSSLRTICKLCSMQRVVDLSNVKVSKIKVHFFSNVFFLKFGDSATEGPLKLSNSTQFLSRPLNIMIGHMLMWYSCHAMIPRV